MVGYRKLSSVCFVCDHAPLYGVSRGTGDHERVAHFPCHLDDLVCLPIRVINGRDYPRRAVNSRRTKVSESDVRRCQDGIRGFAKSEAGTKQRMR